MTAPFELALWVTAVASAAARRRAHLDGELGDLAVTNRARA
jgi:hypothetical protein